MTNNLLNSCDLTARHGTKTSKLAQLAKSTPLGDTVILGDMLYRRAETAEGALAWEPVGQALQADLFADSAAAILVAPVIPEALPKPAGVGLDVEQEPIPIRRRRRHGNGNAQAIDADREAAVNNWGPAPGVKTDDDIDSCVDSDAGPVGGKVDIDGLVKENAAWLNTSDMKPSAGAITDRLEFLAGEGANDSVIEALIASILDRWHADDTAKDRDRIATTLRRDWKREQKDFRDQVAFENRQRAMNHRDPNEGPTDAERAQTRREMEPQVMAMAKRHDLLDAVVARVHESGVTGETNLIKLAYLAGTSRVLAKPVCPLITGASAGGKSYTTQKTLALFPEEDVVQLSSASALSLVYEEQSLVHRILVIYEATPLQQDDNSIFAMLVRVLVSEGMLIHKTTVEDRESPTGRRVETIIKKGPIALVITTTGQLHAENETRMMRYGVTETAAQTGDVMMILARVAQRGHVEHDNVAWQNLQRWIGAGPRTVRVPFAEKLAAAIPPAAVRFRRDFSALLGLIQSHALLYQAQREMIDGCIVATLDDYSAVRDIATLAMEEAIGKRPTTRVTEIVAYVQKMLLTGNQGKNEPEPASEPKQGVRAKRGVRSTLQPTVSGNELTISHSALGNALGIDRSAAQRGVQAALEAGYLVNRETFRGRPMRLTMGDTCITSVVTGNLLPNPESLLGDAN